LTQFPDQEAFQSELGLLGYVKYSVGRNGLPWPKRKTKLDVILTMRITDPVKREVKNWEEWGEPGSAKRCQKLRSTLQMFAGRHHLEQAAEDLAARLALRDRDAL
jgi:hypothetical protein